MNELNKLLGFDVNSVFQRIGDIIRDPSGDPKLTGLLIAIVALFTLIVLSIGVLIILSSPEEDEDVAGEYLDEPAPDPVLATEFTEGEDAAQPTPAKRRGIAVTLAFFAGVLIAVWLITGAVTAQNSTCTSCHADNPHAKTTVEDPHKSVGCVTCHEPGGTAGSVTYMVGPRFMHVVTQMVRPGIVDGYPRAGSSACTRCHSSVAANTLTTASNGLRVSHREPLAAGAECLDCHKLNSGVVSANTVGMTPCLKCHDGKKASSECGTCHSKDIGEAVRASSEATTVGTGTGVITTPNCYACHATKSCDNCHGIRMPHTPEFMTHGHARAAAMDLWFNNGKTCSKCHTAQRRPCTGCHSATMPAHGGRAWAVGHRFGDPKACSVGCHGYKTGGGTRVICKFCH